MGQPGSFFSLIFLWIVLEDANGRTDTVTFGEMPEPGWNLVNTDLPGDLVHPIKVVSIQINEPGFGATATAGSIVFDDLSAVSESGVVTLVEGFEDSFDWVHLATTSSEWTKLPGSRITSTPAREPRTLCSEKRPTSDSAASIAPEDTASFLQ